MKCFLLLLLTICGATSIYAQDERKNYLGGNFSYGVSNTSMTSSGNLFSSKGHTGENYFTIGLDYAHRSSKIVEVCTGLSVTFNDMVTSSTTSWSQQNQWGSGSGSNTSETDDIFFIFSIPFHLKLHFLKYLFIDVGICLNYHPSMGYKWGAGAGAGLGAEYTFKSGLSISLTPHIHYNIMSEESGFSFGYDTLLQKGASVKLGYRF